MNSSERDRLTELPSYDWCGEDPLQVVGLPEAALALDLPAIPKLFADVSGESLPKVPVDVPPTPDLVRVDNPRIELVGAYWHSGWPFAVDGVWVRAEVAERLTLAAASLPAEFGLAIWDGWRDPLLQAELHRVAYQDEALPAGFVNPPSDDPGTPPPHATGGTVDLTLTWDAIPLNLGTRFDAFVELARSESFEGVNESGSNEHSDAGVIVRNLRRLLRSSMVDVGFVQLDCEWWHFEYGTRLWAAINECEPLYGATHPACPA